MLLFLLLLMLLLLLLFTYLLDSGYCFPSGWRVGGHHLYHGTHVRFNSTLALRGRPALTGPLAYQLPSYTPELSSLRPSSRSHEYLGSFTSSSLTAPLILRSQKAEEVVLGKKRVRLQHLKKAMRLCLTTPTFNRVTIRRLAHARPAPCAGSFD